MHLQKYMSKMVRTSSYLLATSGCLGTMREGYEQSIVTFTNSRWNLIGHLFGDAMQLTCNTIFRLCNYFAPQTTQNMPFSKELHQEKRKSKT